MVHANSPAKRETWPDVMRGILILLVLFHHSAAWGKLIYTPFFMTGFFFISGYFHSDTKAFLPFLIDKFKGIIFPTLTLGYMLLVVTKGAQAWHPASLYIWFLCGGAYWFLFCLFAAHMLQYALVRLFRYHSLILLLSSFIVCIPVLYLSQQAEVYPWHAQVACIMQPAMMLGYLARKAQWFNISQKRKIIACCSFSFLYIALCSIAFFMIHMRWCDLMYNEFGNIYLFLPMSLCGSFVIAYFASITAENQPLLALIGRHTLVTYITHGLFLYIVIGGTSVLFRDIAHLPWRPIDHTHPGAWNMTCILAICFAAAASVTLSILLNRYAPWILGKIKRKPVAPPQM